MPNWRLPFAERVECGAVDATAAEARIAVRESELEGEDAWFFYVAFVEDELPKHIEAFRRTV